MDEKKKLQIGDTVDVPGEIVEALNVIKKSKAIAWTGMTVQTKNYSDRTNELWALIRKRMPETENFNINLNGDIDKGFKISILSEIEK